MWELRKGTGNTNAEVTGHTGSTSLLNKCLEEEITSGSGNSLVFFGRHGIISE